MKKNTKSIIKRSLLSGIIYAILMEIFHLIDAEPLKIWRFIFYFIFFGGAMGATRYYDLKSQKENKAKWELNKKNTETNKPASK